MLFAAPASAGADAMATADDTTMQATSGHFMSAECGADAEFCDPGCTGCSCACCHLSLPLAGFEVILARAGAVPPPTPATSDVPRSYLPELPPPLV